VNVELIIFVVVAENLMNVEMIFLEKYGKDLKGGYSLAGCDYCLGDLVDDETLIEYLLDKIKMTREEVIKEINYLCRV